VVHPSRRHFCRALVQSCLGDLRHTWCVDATRETCPVEPLCNLAWISSTSTVPLHIHPCICSYLYVSTHHFRQPSTMDRQSDTSSLPAGAFVGLALSTQQAAVKEKNVPVAYIMLFTFGIFAAHRCGNPPNSDPLLHRTSPGKVSHGGRRQMMDRLFVRSHSTRVDFRPRTMRSHPQAKCDSNSDCTILNLLTGVSSCGFWRADST